MPSECSTGSTPYRLSDSVIYRHVGDETIDTWRLDETRDLYDERLRVAERYRPTVPRGDSLEFDLIRIRFDYACLRARITENLADEY